jgi:hypothetical protein
MSVEQQRIGNGNQLAIGGYATNLLTELTWN